MTRYLEDLLDVPLRTVLPLLQERITNETRYFGIPTRKNPLDYWVYQEILFDSKPDVVVEIGNFCGGSTLALAHLCELMGGGRVIGVDVSHARIAEAVRRHPRITLIEGDARTVTPQVKKLVHRHERVMVIEDSSHAFDNTLGILRDYADLLQPGDFFIVEDGICHHGLDVGPKPGPLEAVEVFVAERPDFMMDRTKESFRLTWNPRGFLRRRGAPGGS